MLTFPTLWENATLDDWMMRTPHYQSGLDKTWIVSKFAFSSCFFSTKDLQLSLSWNFLLPLYVEVEAQVMASMISPPSIKKHVRYDLFVRFLVDDEAIE